MSRTAIGVFATSEAERLLDELVSRGFPTEGISLLSHDEGEARPGMPNRGDERAVGALFRIGRSPARPSRRQRFGDRPQHPGGPHRGCGRVVANRRSGLPLRSLVR